MLDEFLHVGFFYCLASNVFFFKNEPGRNKNSGGELNRECRKIVVWTGGLINYGGGGGRPPLTRGKPATFHIAVMVKFASFHHLQHVSRSSYSTLPGFSLLGGGGGGGPPPLDFAPPPVGKLPPLFSPPPR